MERSILKNLARGVGFGLCFTLVLGVPSSWAGSLRLKMTDGTAMEVPYYWEEGGEVKFEVPGGVAGIPKVQVASVQEVVTSKEFDPEVLTESAELDGKTAQLKGLEALISESSSGSVLSEKLTPEESLQLLRESRGAAEGPRSAGKIHASLYEVEADFSEVVRTPGSGVMIEMRKVLSSRNDLRQNGFSLILYDGEGNLIQRQNCRVSEMDVDRKAMKQMGLRGRIFSLMASVRPDERIKRYEITVDRRY
jgi:hypothetical protein